MKFFPLLLAFSFLNALEEPLPDEVRKVMRQDKYAHSTWGLYMKDLNTGEVLYNLNGQELFSPASTSKLASTAALLHALGEDYRFQTPVYVKGKIDRGELRGDLILVGQGDLTLGGRQSDPDTLSFTKMDHIIANEVPGALLTKEDPLTGIHSLAAQVYQRGIRKIIGEIQIDDQLFETVEKREMVLSSVMLNENLIDIVINPTGIDQKAELKYRPQIPGFVVENQVKTVPIDGDLSIAIKRDNQKIVVTGTIPLEQNEIVRTYAVKDPKAFVKAAFIQALKNQGVRVVLNGRPQKVDSYQNLEQVAVWRSPPLAEYVKLILKVSHNLGADLIPLLLASHKGKKTFEEGMRMIGDFLVEEVKLSLDDFVMNDAAGGNENRFTPEGEVQLLEYMCNQNFMDFKHYEEDLPFEENTEAVGKVWAKPGTGISLNLATDKLFLTTQALAGYIHGKNGHLFAFMVVVNNGRMAIIDDIFAIFEDQSQISSFLYNHTGESK